jgi:hypothetical protein
MPGLLCRRRRFGLRPILVSVSPARDECVGQPFAIVLEGIEGHRGPIRTAAEHTRRPPGLRRSPLVRSGVRRLIGRMSRQNPIARQLQSSRRHRETHVRPSPVHSRRNRRSCLPAIELVVYQCDDEAARIWNAALPTFLEDYSCVSLSVGRGIEAGQSRRAFEIGCLECSRRSDRTSVRMTSQGSALV